MTSNTITHTTLHLTPEDVWQRQRDHVEYLPEAYARDGFIHCTDDEQKMLWVANSFYTGDERAFVLLDVDLGQNGERTVYEDPDNAFPHIYGPIKPSAVTRVRSVTRGADGAFLGFADLPAGE